MASVVPGPLGRWRLLLPLSLSTNLRAATIRREGGCLFRSLGRHRVLAFSLRDDRTCSSVGRCGAGDQTDAARGPALAFGGIPSHTRRSNTFALLWRARSAATRPTRIPAIVTVLLRAFIVTVSRPFTVVLHVQSMVDALVRIQGGYGALGPRSGAARTRIGQPFDGIRIP